MFRRADFIRFANIVPAAKACGLRKECRNTMSKICRVCGMMNMDNASVCSKCHSSLGTVNMTDQNRFPINGGISNGGNLNGGNVQQIDPELEKNYAKHQKTQQNSSKILRVLIVIAVVGVVAGYFGVQYYKNNTPPDENWVQENLPEDILYYTLDGEEQTLKFQSLQIQSRATKDGVDHTKCKVILSDKFLKKTKFINITSKRYDSLGWKVQDWKEYKNEKVTLKPANKKRIYSYLKEKYSLEGLKNFQQSAEDTKNKARSYTCDFKNKYAYLNYSGTCGVTEYLDGVSYNGVYKDDSVTGNYATEYDMEIIEGAVDWKLDGTYSYEDMGVKINVTVKTDGNGKLTWKADYTIYEEDDESYDQISGQTEYPTESEERIDITERDYGGNPASDREYSFSIGKNYWMSFTRDEVNILEKDEEDGYVIKNRSMTKEK